MPIASDFAAIDGPAAGTRPLEEGLENWGEDGTEAPPRDGLDCEAELAGFETNSSVNLPVRIPRKQETTPRMVLQCFSPRHDAFLNLLNASHSAQQVD